MTDKQTIDRINSLIRINPRKRLKAAPNRGEILGGVGMAGGAVLEEEVLFPDSLYMTVAISDTVWHLYSVDKDGGAPVFMANLSPYAAWPGINSTSGNLDYFVGALESEWSQGTQTLKYAKNGSLIISGTPYMFSSVVTSAYIFILDDAWTFHKYDLSGTALGTFSSGSQYSISFLNANDYGLLFYENDSSVDGYTILDHSGGVIVSKRGPTTNNAWENGLQSSNKYAFFIGSKDSGSFPNYVYKYYVVNNLGAEIATFTLNASDYYAVAGRAADRYIATTDRLFVVGLKSGTYDTVILTYELTMTIDGSNVATDCVIGALLHTTILTGTTYWPTDGCADAATFVL